MKIVWFSEIKWDYLKTRKQQIIEHFPDHWEVLFIESYVSGKTNSYFPRKVGRVVHVTIPFFKSTPSRLANAVQNNLFFRFCFQSIIFFWVKIVLRMTGFHIKEKIIGISNIYYINIVSRLSKEILVYDCNDIPMGFSSSLGFTEKYFRKTLKKSDLIITVSKKLIEKIRIYEHRNVSLIGNGVDFELFINAQVQIPSDAGSIPGPRIVYAGALADWFDVDLLEKAALRFPGYSFILIGPFLSAGIKTRIENFPCKNIHILGVKKHQELPSYYRMSDVCIIPFKKNELTNGLNPNKLYEYLAAGKQVVTRDYSDEIEALAGDIYVAKSDEEFIAMIGKAVKTPFEEVRLRSIARQNSWKSKSKQFAELIENNLQKNNE